MLKGVVIKEYKKVVISLMPISPKKRGSKKRKRRV